MITVWRLPTVSEQHTPEVAEVVAELPLSRFRVALGDGSQLTAVLSRDVVGRGRPPRVSVGDRVLVERSPFESDACRTVPSWRTA